MTQRIVPRESVLEDALLLDTLDRELLIMQLAETIEKEPGYDEAWVAEIECRLKAIDDGTEELFNWEEAQPRSSGQARLSRSNRATTRRGPPKSSDT